MNRQRPSKSYRGRRVDGETIVQVTTCHADGTESTQPLEARTDLGNRSPAGLEWGHGGSGPAQLALALLADHLQMPDELISAFSANKNEVKRIAVY